MAAKDPAIRWYTFNNNGQITMGKKIRFRGTVLILASGDFGGGTLEGGYIDDNNTFQGMGTAFELTAQGVLELPAGTNLDIMLELTGATSPTLKVGYVADGFELS